MRPIFSIKRIYELILRGSNYYKLKELFNKENISIPHHKILKCLGYTMNHFFKRRFLPAVLISIGFLFPHHILAQAPVNRPDTFRIIQILQGESLRQIKKDSATNLETIAGNVILKEGLTTFKCDSAVINHHQNILESFGHIHINQNDSIHTYANHLLYKTNEHIAYLDGNVKLTDNKGTLLTKNLTYNLTTNIADYSNGGKVINGKTVLYSDNGTYYADTKDVHFKNNVHLVDPKYDIVTDSLIYNTQTQVTTFITETLIKNKEGASIYTKDGTYDLKNGKAFFGSRPIIKDSSRIYTADNSAIDEESGIAQLEGNAVIRDSAGGYTVMGNQVFLNQKNNTFLATQKPVLIFKGDGNDSTYISADTLFSGIQKRDTSSNQYLDERDTIHSTVIVMNRTDTAFRYFQAFHHVRIFNDSLQAVCDSLYYSSDDSTFRLMTNPLVFANHSQISGDTILLFTKNRMTSRIYVFESAMLVNRPNKELYNQIAGRTITGYFKEGVLDFMKVKGAPAESIYYPQNDDSAYIGMNNSHGDIILIYFVNKELNKVKFINNVEGALYPLRQIPGDKKYLRGFSWQEERRPKGKFELFE